MSEIKLTWLDFILYHYCCSFLFLCLFLFLKIVYFIVINSYVRNKVDLTWLDFFFFIFQFWKQAVKMFWEKEVFLKIGLLKMIRWKLQSKTFKSTYEGVHLLKMNYFIYIFQGFRLQILEHLFSITPLSSCFWNF